MYLSEKGKINIGYIVMLWDELGHEPSFKEFDADPRTPRANALSYEFGSYENAVNKARYYRSHPELLKPSSGDYNDRINKPTKDRQPPPKKKSHKTTTTSKAIPIPQQPVKPLVSKPVQAVKPTPEIKPPQEKKPAETSKSPMPTVMKWKESSPPPKPKAEAPKVSPPPTKKPIEPPKMPSTPPKATEAKSSQPIAKKSTSAPPAPSPKRAPNANLPLLVNYLGKRIALICSDHYLAYSFGDSVEEYPYQVIPNKESKASTSSMSYRVGGSYKVVTSAIIFDVPLLKVTKKPVLAHGNDIFDFPEPKEKTLLIVPYEVAIVARDNGRKTDDLIFPATYYELDGTIYCAEFGHL